MSGTLGSLLQQAATDAIKAGKGAKKAKNEDVTAVSDLFAKEKHVIAEPVIVDEEINVK